MACKKRSRREGVSEDHVSQFEGGLRLEDLQGVLCNEKRSRRSSRDDYDLSQFEGGHHWYRFLVAQHPPGGIEGGHGPTIALLPRSTGSCYKACKKDTALREVLVIPVRSREGEGATTIRLLPRSTSSCLQAYKNKSALREIVVAQLVFAQPTGRQLLSSAKYV